MKKGTIKRLLPEGLRNERTYQFLQRVRNPIWMGNLRRKVPVTRFGWQRGTPIDRYYIEEFLEKHRADIAGRVLEVRDSGYTRRFGQPGLQSDVLDINPQNPAATIIADLSAADRIPSDTFDCFILTQTLQYIYDVNGAVRHAHRMLKPGGVLLATVPSVQVADNVTPDLWRLTALGCKELFGRYFGVENVEVEPRGNALAAIAFLSGLGSEEFKAVELALRAPDYAVVVCVRARKA